MSTSGCQRPSSTNHSRQPQLRVCGQSAVVRLVIFVVLPLLLSSFQNAPTVTDASGQSSFEFTAYCQKLCIWGRGGNLCRCNAVHFVGKRRPTLGFSKRVRVDRSATTKEDARATRDKTLLAVTVIGRPSVTANDVSSGRVAIHRLFGATKMDSGDLGSARLIGGGQLNGKNTSRTSSKKQEYRQVVGDEPWNDAGIRRAMKNVESKKGESIVVVKETSQVTPRVFRQHHESNNSNTRTDVRRGASSGPAIDIIYTRLNDEDVLTTNSAAAKNKTYSLPSSPLRLLASPVEKILRIQRAKLL